MQGGDQVHGHLVGSADVKPWHEYQRTVIVREHGSITSVLL